MHLFVKEKSPENFIRRRRWMFLAAYSVGFVIGSENAIIYPTAWQYLQELGTPDENILGLVISAFNISALVSGVCFGILGDKLERSRWIVLWFNPFSVIGQCMYLFGGSAWMLIAGRFVAGIGAGLATVIMGEIAKGSRVSERARIMALGFGSRQLGLVFGPVYNLMISNSSIDLGFVVVTESNFSGFLMALLWGFYQVVFFVCYFDAGQEMKAILEAEAAVKVPKDERSQNVFGNDDDGRIPERLPILEGVQSHETGERHDGHPSVKTKTNYSDRFRPDDCDDDDERRPLVSAKRIGYAFPIKRKEDQTSNLERRANKEPSLSKKYLDGFLTDTVLPLLFLQFLSFFIQNVLETTIPPATQYFFGYGPRENSFIYVAIGVEAITVYVLFYLSLRCDVSERVVLVGSCSVMVLGCAAAMAVTSQLERDRPEQFPLYMAGCAIVFLAVPMASITTVTIFSKALPRDVQGFAQGIRRLCNYLGLILGPLYGGGLAYRGLLLYSLPLVMSALALALVVLSYPKYKIFLER